MIVNQEIAGFAQCGFRGLGVCAMRLPRARGLRNVAYEGFFRGAFFKGLWGDSRGLVRYGAYV